MSSQLQAALAGGSSSVTPGPTKTIRWATTLTSTAPAGDDIPDQTKDVDSTSSLQDRSVLERQILLHPQPRLDKKWMSCDLRHLSDENMLSVLYNTLVQDGELVKPFPPRMYTNVAGTRVAYRGKENVFFTSCMCSLY